MKRCDEDKRRKEAQNGKTCRRADKFTNTSGATEGLAWKSCEGLLKDTYGCKTGMKRNTH